MSQNLDLKNSETPDISTTSEELSEKKKKWKFKDHWKSILAWSLVVLVIVLGYVIVAAVGAPEYKNGTKVIAAVAGNFRDAGNAFTWYLNAVWIDNFLGVPAILLAVLSFIGYIVLKRGFVDSLIGALKTAIGVLLLNVGSTALSGIASPLFNGFRSWGGATVVPLDPYQGWNSGLNFLTSFATGNNYTSWVSYALLVGFAFNILLVSLRRWTNCHAVMTTGHIMFQQSAVVVPFVYLLFFANTALSGGSIVEPSVEVGTVLFAGIFLGSYWSVGTTMTIKATNKITENANFAIGHQQMMGITAAFHLGRFFKFTKKGQEVVSAENRKLSKKFRIFEDNIFVQSVLIILLFLVLAVVLEVAAPTGSKFSDIVGSNTWWPNGTIGSFWVVKIFMGALFLVAAILAIITGVRMFVTELQQSFQGISEKIIPGSVVAVDIAAVYGFSPNAVTYGFISGTIAQYIGVGIVIGLTAAGLPTVVVIPLFITLFFNSGAVGVYANVNGGWKASIIVPAIFSFIEIIVVAFALGSVQELAQVAGANGAVAGKLSDGSYISPISTGYNGMVDWNLFFGFPLIFAAMHPIAAYIILPLEVVIMLLAVQYVDSGLSSKVPPLKKVLPINKLFNFKNKNAEPVMV